MVSGENNRANGRASAGIRSVAQVGSCERLNKSIIRVGFVHERYFGSKLWRR